MRSQEEIVKRINESDDLFGTQIGDLVDYLEFENAKQFLNQNFIDKVEKSEEEWVVKKEPKNEILDYLDFAYSKAEDERGLSAARSMLHFKSWIWLDDDKFYNEIIDLIDNYTDYGIPALDKISEHYGYLRN
jgi:hypothetical protein